MATTVRTCEECGTEFEAKTKRARFCKATCRVKANRRPSKTGAAAGTAEPPAPKPTLYAGGELLGQVIADLSAVGVLETIPGKAAVALAYRVESPMETGSAAAAMTRELSRLVEEAKALKPKQNDEIDDLDGSVEAKLRLVK